MEDIGNAFLVDLHDSGSMTPFPALLQVDFALGTYNMPGGLQEVAKMSLDGPFSRKFRLLAVHIQNYVMRSAPGVTILACEPVWIIN